MSGLLDMIMAGAFALSLALTYLDYGHQAKPRVRPLDPKIRRAMKPPRPVPPPPSVRMPLPPRPKRVSRPSVREGSRRTTSRSSSSRRRSFSGGGFSFGK